jgi:hypothetical protein
MIYRPRLLLLSLPLAFAAGCSGSSPVSPGAVADVLTQQLETSSISFRFSPGDSISSSDADWQQQYHDWATAQLGVTLPGKVRYNKYRDNGQMNAVTGRGCCFAEPGTLTVHTIYPRDNHETVHVYSNRLGSPTNFLSEGLAVAFQVSPASGDFTPRWNGAPLHAHARAFRQGGQLIAIADMLTTDQFRSHADTISYPEAGSFAWFLIDTYGLDRYLAQFPGSNPMDSASRIRSTFQSAFGFSIERAEAEWHAMLDGNPASRGGGSSP